MKTVTLNDAYEFMNYIQRERKNQNVTRARKCSSLKGYFNYLATKKCVLDSNPVEQLEVPKKKKSLPKYLTLEQSLELLNAVDGDYKERDYCILTLFLNCGLRVSEMASLNYTDIHQDDTMRVVGKGNKERIITLIPPAFPQSKIICGCGPLTALRTNMHCLSAEITAE